MSRSVNNNHNYSNKANILNEFQGEPGVITKHKSNYLLVENFGLQNIKTIKDILSTNENINEN